MSCTLGKEHKKTSGAYQKMNYRVRLNELVEIKYGKAFKTEDRPKDGVFPIYGSNGIVGKSYEALVDQPTIIIGRKGAVGEVHLAENGCWPIDTAFYTLSLSKHAFSLRYLYLYLKSLDLKKLAITSTIPGINRNTLYSQEIPLPPLAEQERIVCLLDEAEALRKLRAQASARMEDFVPALFHELFGDPEHTKYDVRDLTELIDPNRPITYGILKPGPNIPDGVPYIRVVDIKGGHLQKDQLRKTTSRIAAEYKRSILSGDDVLVTIRGR
jgi:type I restriction enzyme, S subunit